LGWGRRRRNKGGEGRQSGDTLIFAKGITDKLLLSVISSALLTVNWSRYYTKIQVWIPQDSVGKIACKNFHVSEPLFFFKFWIFHLYFHRYIPTAVVRQYIPTELQM
jgi:hypothetical protein